MSQSHGGNMIEATKRAARLLVLVALLGVGLGLVGCASSQSADDGEHPHAEGEHPHGEHPHEHPEGEHPSGDDEDDHPTSQPSGD